jgi:hypothetical protein
VGKFSAGKGGWQVSNAFFLLMLNLLLVIVIEMITTGVKMFRQA